MLNYTSSIKPGDNCNLRLLNSIFLQDRIYMLPRTTLHHMENFYFRYSTAVLRITEILLTAAPGTGCGRTSKVIWLLCDLH